MRPTTNPKKHTDIEQFEQWSSDREKKFRESPKIYCSNVDGVLMTGLGRTFLLSLESGVVPYVFALTPEHLKRVLQMLTAKVEAYEKEYGEIEVSEYKPYG